MKYGKKSEIEDNFGAESDSDMRNISCHKDIEVTEISHQSTILETDHNSLPILELPESATLLPEEQFVLLYTIEDSHDRIDVKNFYQSKKEIVRLDDIMEMRGTIENVNKNKSVARRKGRTITHVITY